MKLNLRFLFFILLFNSCFFYAQNGRNESSNANPLTHRQHFTAEQDIFGTRNFIENKGQFNGKLPGDDKILFMLDHGPDKVYLTDRGLVYELNKAVPLTEKQREAMERGEGDPPATVEKYFVRAAWYGTATQPCVVIPSEKQEHYLTYGGPEYNAFCYKKVTYKEVYPNIDVEYTIPTEKEMGIEYSLILHPGADVSHIKLLYSGDVKRIRLNDHGEVNIKTPVETIVEHAPHSFYEDQKSINSQFLLSGDTLGFQFPEGFETKRTLIIDPWVTTVTTFTPSNSAYDVDYDFGGNTFIYGAASPNKIAMYNAAGILQWTFGGVVTVPSWSNVGSVSNFGVDKLTGKCFTGQGVVGSGAQVIRINVNGNYDNFISTANGQYREIWEMGFHCLTAEVFIFGGSTAGNLSAATINSVNASLNISTFQPTNAVCCQDIASHAIDDQGKIFVIYASGNPSMSNKICLVNSTFNGNIWTMPTGYNALNENGNKIAYQPSATSNGFNCLAVNGNYLYYYDGLNLAAYSKLTGVNVASITIPGATLKRQGGIAVDDCNHLFLGGNGSILTYSFNGTAFSTLTPIPLTVNTPTQNVHDIKLDRNTKTLYVCGTGFVGTYAATISYTCSVPMGLCVFNQAGVGASSSSITCATLGSATVTPNGGIGPYSYTWMPSGQTGSVATGLSPGTYSVVVYDAGYNATYTATTTFLSPVPLTGSLSSTFMLACNGVSNGTASVVNLAGGSGNQSYLWTNGVNTQTSPVASGLAAGNYTVYVTDALTGCVFSPTFTIYSPPLLSSFISASSPSACLNTTIGLSAFSSGGVPPYTYSWTTGSTLGGITINQAAQGTYSYALNVRDQNNCLSTSSITVDYIPYPVITASNFSICPFETGTLVANGASTYTWNGLTTGSSFTASPLVNTQYTVTGSALSCESTITASIIIKPVPVPVFSSNSPICNGQNLWLSASTATASVWTGPLTFTSALVSPTLTAAAPSNSGVYQVTVTAANSCTAATQGTVTINPTPTISASGSTVCITQAVNLSASSFAGANYVWTGPNGFVSLLQNPAIASPVVASSGNYTLKVTSTPGCTNTAIVHVTVTPLPVVSFTSNSPQCYGKTLSFNAGATTGALNYSWSGPLGFSSNLQNPLINNVTVPASGNYTLTVSTGPCTVSASHSATIHPLPLPIVFNTAPVCETKAFQIGVNNCGTTYTWTGPGNYSSNQQNLSFLSATMNHNGVYTLGVTDANTCRNYATTTVTILQNPILNATGDLVCYREPALLTVTGANTYLWTGPLNFTATGSSPQIPSALNIQTWTYTVLGTGVNGCTAIATATVGTRVLPVPGLTITPRVCVKSLIYLQGEGGLLYHWEGPLNFISDLQNTSFTAWNTGMSGSYSLMVTDAYGCRGYTAGAVIVDPEPTGAMVASKLFGCVPFCSTFSIQSNTGGAISNFHWQIENQQFQTAQINYCFTNPGNFEVKGSFESDKNCRGNLSQMVEVYPLPEADFSYTPLKPVENQDLVIFTNRSKGEYQNQWTWAFNDGNHKERKTEHTSYMFEDAGIYAVVLLVQNKWTCADTIVKTIEVVTDFNVYIPNAFTPNGDGLNDTFYPVMRGVKQFELQIFDRWGALIFSSNTNKNTWDGTFRAEDCKQDVYNYKLVLLNVKGEEKLYSGSVKLYR